jgi:hypothetical protein
VRLSEYSAEDLHCLLLPEQRLAVVDRRPDFVPGILNQNSMFSHTIYMGRRLCFASIGQEKSMKKPRKTGKKVNADALGRKQGPVPGGQGSVPERTKAIKRLREKAHDKEPPCSYRDSRRYNPARYTSSTMYIMENNSVLRRFA